MANSNFIVQNGLTVGNLTIDAVTSNITLPAGSSIYVGSAALAPGGSSNFSSVVSSGNVTAAALTSNGSATIGTTLGIASGGLILDGSAATISSTSTTITIDPASAGSGGQVTIAGNLYVTGTTFTVDSQTITVNDKDIVVANNQSTAAGIDGAGIIAGNVSVGGGIAKLIYNNATSSWQSNVAITPAANASVNLGGTANWWNNVYGVTFIGVASTAKYADLAENYSADAVYEPGTVVVFGGEKEITISNTTHDNRVAGVVSTKPAYLMNSDLKTGTPVALTGRVPCRVQGPVYKGQPLVQGMNWGIAQGLNPDYFTPGCVVGKALEEIADNSIKTIEIVVGRF